MHQSCGSEHRGSIASAQGRMRRRYPLLVTALVVALTGAAGALANTGSKGSRRPAPDLLWRSYPLNSAPAAPAPHPKATIRPTSSPKPTAGFTASSFGVSAGVWVAIGLAALLVLLAIVYVLLRRAPYASAKLADARARAADSVNRARGSAGKWAIGAQKALALRSASALHRLRVLGATLVVDVRGGTAPAAVRGSAEPSPARLDPRPRSVPTEEAIVRPEHAAARTESVQTLKRKLTTRDNPRRREVSVLKEKLAATRDNRPKKSPPRPTPIATVRTVAAAECRIDWWRGYVRSEFNAKQRTPDGKDAIISTSPSFRWSKPSAPPATLRHVAEAHAALIADLEARGWIVSGRGNEWYALKLKRPPSRRSVARKGSHD
jgi:hypothetical protein